MVQVQVKIFLLELVLISPFISHSLVVIIISKPCMNIYFFTGHWTHMIIICGGCVVGLQKFRSKFFFSFIIPSLAQMDQMMGDHAENLDQKSNGGYR